MNTNMNNIYFCFIILEQSYSVSNYIYELLQLIFYCDCLYTKKIKLYIQYYLSKGLVTMKSTKYKVIKLLNEKEILINYGSKQGAKENQKVRIYELGETIVDPDTNEPLGTLDIIKDDLEIYRTYPNFSICRKLKNKITNALNPLSNFSITSVISEDLNLDKHENYKKHLKNTAIKIGDNVDILY